HLLVGGAQQLDVEPIAFRHAVLLTAGVDDCVHGLTSLRGPDRAHSPTSSVSMTRPRPSQCGHVVDRDSSRPSPMRLRVISTRPSSEMSKTWVRVLSRDSASRKALPTSARFALTSMSMK